MPQLQKYSSLTEAQISFIINSLAKDKQLDLVKSNFNKFFTGHNIDGGLILQVGVQHQKEIKELIAKYEVNFDDIRIANERNQLKLLDTLFDECLIPREVAIGKDGVPITKVDFNTALKCIEVAAKIVNQVKVRELKADSTRASSTEDDPEISGPPKYEVSIVHKQ